MLVCSQYAKWPAIARYSWILLNEYLCSVRNSVKSSKGLLKRPALRSFKTTGSRKTLSSIDALLSGMFAVNESVGNYAQFSKANVIDVSAAAAARADWNG